MELPKNNYTSLINAVANVGPIAISVAASGNGWQTYGGGVLSTCDWDEDHAVQLVGYGTDGGETRGTHGKTSNSHETICCVPSDGF